jgi:hypothetical protein
LFLPSPGCSWSEASKVIELQKLISITITWQSWNIINILCCKIGCKSSNKFLYLSTRDRQGRRGWFDLYLLNLKTSHPGACVLVSYVISLWWYLNSILTSCDHYKRFISFFNSCWFFHVNIFFIFLISHNLFKIISIFYVKKFILKIKF